MFIISLLSSLPRVWPLIWEKLQFPLPSDQLFGGNWLGGSREDDDNVHNAVVDDDKEQTKSIPIRKAHVRLGELNSTKAIPVYFTFGIIQVMKKRIGKIIFINILIFRKNTIWGVHEIALYLWITK